MSALDDLLTCLRFPSVSTDSRHNADTRACADWLVAKLTSMGLTTSLHETPGHPVIVAKNKHIAGRRTVLLYGHYDVQPAEPFAEWKSPPFEPTIRDGVIFCRGATDNKGQLIAHVSGLAETLAKHGDLPVNLTILFEGEEEIGSPNLKPFLEAHRQQLACDVVAISDTGMVGPGIGTFTYGLRGIACMELKVHGPSIDLHSGIFGGAVANPATIAARLAASLHDDQGRVLIPGFYDDVKPLASWERSAWAELGDGDAETLSLTGVPALFGEPEFTERERRWARPTAEVNGIGGGYQGEGSKTVIPREAFVKLSFRLVPDQNPEQILDLATAYLLSKAPASVRLEIKRGHTGQAYLMDPQGPLGKAAQRALTKTFGGKIALIREGGSIPIVQAFKDVLKADTLLLGLALPDCQAHAPNENFPIANLEAGIRLNQALLAELGA
ncbi:acetylornithine deacetylase/succinyl-diaminopimelate desuccinylase-like protein [Prosthecobacter fusiformis]|uniref:Acetylornithine deacetylase/succinyl-diaminopimelate desuccinylase-like protein n=1 Tax=Prosthecobacter fusiformis TaxID=48464 RepID=A0A4R7SS81_9BACT|nr:dipeptidase [Prosthecobacter fusiformis]TDU81038.1 acetylornithine deacetylase/succinyl-diaminopimelate desuccinylase-like protein [Prosthecobacter fusiformis]